MGVLDEQIDHVVVLMLENRSFDNLLGAPRPGAASFNVLTGDETNPLSQTTPVSPIRVWNHSGRGPDAMTIPTPDPGESWDDMNMQLFGLHGTPGRGVPSMDGFVDNYATKQGDDGNHPAPDAVMHYFTREQLPVMNQLADSFAVCDQWFASAPCQTWPNRFFLHTGTAGGYANNEPLRLHEMPTIFTRFNRENIQNGWNIYFHDIPQALSLSDLWEHHDRFHSFDRFKLHVDSNRLPAYAFIEPRYFADTAFPSDMHPPHDVSFGEGLIADVYNTLRQSALWQRTLLVITFDEHGGCYDHVPPPLAVRPDDRAFTEGFTFDRYGVRVPTLLISPYIRPGTVLRASAPSLPHQGPPYPFDHTSVIATLRNRFHLGAPLTERDRVAPDLSTVFNLDQPENLGPEQVTASPQEVADEHLEAAQHEVLSDFQEALHDLASILPDLSGASDDKTAAVAAHKATLRGSPAAKPSPPADSEGALAVIKDRMEKLLGWI